jgi:hypothetical protein
MFFGLGSSIKFPADYTMSPYTVISTGITTLPQRLEFPFSLISRQASADSMPLSYNELIPAWMLSDNIYAVVRNEAKYKQRNRSLKNNIDLNVFRPEIIDMMISSRAGLMNVPSVKDIYTELDIIGLGKNYLTEANRTKAIENYTFYIQLYALRELSYHIDRILSQKNSIDSLSIYEEDNNTQWPHAMQVLHYEKLIGMTLKDNMEKLLSMNKLFLSSIFNSKDKDRIRGNKIINNYNKYHKPTEEDSLITDISEKIKIEQTRIEQIISCPS